MADQLTRPKRVLKLEAARKVAADPQRLAELIGVPLDHWAGRCHAVSLALVRTGEFGRSRVARGGAEGIMSQHSWIVLGDDCYDPAAVIVDPTYLPATEGRGEIVVDYARNLSHAPHGAGSIWRCAGSIWRWTGGEPGGAAVELTPKVPLSQFAQDFLAVLGPMDVRGWYAFATHVPVEGWPAAEILTAIEETFPCAVPVDKLGMVTDLNPRGLYW